MGYRVIGAARRVEQLGKLVAEIEEAGGTAAACHLDVTQEATYETLFKFAEARFGGVDHVLLNAGATTKLVGPGDMEGPEDLASYKAGIDVNIIGTVLGMKHGIAALRERGGGSITTMSSNGGGFPRGGCAGELGNLTFATPYCHTSAALDQLVRMSAYYKNENIRVYGLKIGVYNSDMIDQWVDHFQKNVDAETTADSFAGFNFFFSGLLGDPVHIGKIYETLVNNTTKWPAGANITCDSDVTYDGVLTYQVSDTDAIMPTIPLDQLRGYDGGPYESKDERTAAFIENLKAAA